MSLSAMVGPKRNVLRTADGCDISRCKVRCNYRACNSIQFRHIINGPGAGNVDISVGSVHHVERRIYVDTAGEYANKRAVCVESENVAV